MRFFLVDRILEWQPGARAVGVKGFTRTDDFVAQGPFLPRSLLIESLAQLASYLLGDSEAREGREVLSLMTQVEQLRWHADVRPGDRVVLTAEILSRRPEGARVAVTATVDERPIAEGRLGFVFFAAETPEQAADFSWTRAMLARLTAGIAPPVAAVS